MNNTSGMNPAGHRILIKPQEIKKVSAGGIILSTESSGEREQMANTTGVVVAMGDTCYHDKPNPWCKVGDKVIFAKYAGLLYLGKDGMQYRMINDEDITGTLDGDVDLVDPYLAKNGGGQA
jgi:co-chaperonin GroES (HSP10)